MIDSETAIKIDNLGKRYRIGLKDEMHNSLMSAFLSILKSPFENYKKYRSLYRFDDIENIEKCTANGLPEDIIWALKEITGQVWRPTEGDHPGDSAVALKYVKENKRKLGLK